MFLFVLIFWKIWWAKLNMVQFHFWLAWIWWSCLLLLLLLLFWVVCEYCNWAACVYASTTDSRVMVCRLFFCLSEYSSASEFSFSMFNINLAPFTVEFINPTNGITLMKEYLLNNASFGDGFLYGQIKVQPIPDSTQVRSETLAPLRLRNTQPVGIALLPVPRGWKLHSKFSSI